MSVSMIKADTGTTSNAMSQGSLTIDVRGEFEVEDEARLCPVLAFELLYPVNPCVLLHAMTDRE